MYCKIHYEPCGGGGGTFRFLLFFRTVLFGGIVGGFHNAHYPRYIHGRIRGVAEMDQRPHPLATPPLSRSSLCLFSKTRIRNNAKNEKHESTRK